MNKYMMYLHGVEPNTITETAVIPQSAIEADVTVPSADKDRILGLQVGEMAIIHFGTQLQYYGRCYRVG